MIIQCVFVSLSNITNSLYAWVEISRSIKFYQIQSTSVSYDYFFYSLNSWLENIASQCKTMARLLKRLYFGTKTCHTDTFTFAIVLWNFQYTTQSFNIMVFSVFYAMQWFWLKLVSITFSKIYSYMHLNLTATCHVVYQRMLHWTFYIQERHFIISFATIESELEVVMPFDFFKCKYFVAL